MRLIFVLLLTAQILLLVGCDKGRNINQNERDKVLFKDGNDKTDFSQNLQIYPEQMTPQSEYSFIIYNPKVSVFIPVTLTSLLKFDNDHAPQLDFLDRKVEMKCVEEFAPPVCSTWSYSFPLNSMAPNAPSLNFEIQMSPLRKYSLKSKVGDSFVRMAEYDTFLLTFNWLDYRYAYIVAKQTFYVNADLIKSPMGSNVNDNFTHLFAASYFWPSPSYLLTLHKTEEIKNETLSLEFYGVYKNIKTQELSKVHYRLEAL